MSSFRHTAFLLLAAVLFPGWLYGIEILDADPELTTRFSGPKKTDMHFGAGHFEFPHRGNHLVGFAYYEDTREMLPVFGFRLTEAFLAEWQKQGEAQFIFSIIEFHEGDPHKICPIHIEQLASVASAAEAVARPPRKRLGSILRDELQTDHLYAFSIPFDPTQKPGDVVWIGMDCTKPDVSGNNNLVIAGDLSAFPGGSPPLLLAGSPETASRTVQGMSLLQLLNRRFHAPANETKVSSREAVLPRWVNPLHSRQELETLGLFRTVLERELIKLPARPVAVPARYQGFHSSIQPENETWELRFPISDKGDRFASLALYPAVQRNDQGVEAYAFPKRFTITAIPPNDGPAVTVADWSQADFPQQGITPVIFPFTSEVYKEIRMTVYKGVPMPGGGHAFALSEISFRHFYTTPVPLECAPAAYCLENPPYWSAAYATDGQTAFGSPARSTDATNGTFRTVTHENQPVQLVIQQSRATTWESLEFHPTQHPDGLPPEGFPKTLLIEFSDRPDFSKIIRNIHTTTEMANLSNAEFPFVLRFPPVRARCVRITFNPAASKEQFLQLEEVTFNGGHPLQLQEWYSEDRTFSGSPGIAALYDRIINGYNCDPPIRRAVNLNRRNVLIEDLNHIKAMMEAIHRAHDHTVAWLTTSAVTLAASFLFITIIQQRRLAKRKQRRICQRIQQDLHDEIGSQLSAISMITNHNKNAADLKPSIRTELADANHCARTAMASLTEVIWLTDKEILTLDQCFDIMKKRAEKMVHTMKLELDFPKKVRSMGISYQTKRNLILLFTEALNNALKHSGADTVGIEACLKDRQLTLTIRDNGRGFTPDTEHAGMGMKNMHARARKIGGKLEVESAPGQGTTIRLSAKL